MLQTPDTGTKSPPADTNTHWQSSICVMKIIQQKNVIICWWIPTVSSELWTGKEEWIDKPLEVYSVTSTKSVLPSNPFAISNKEMSLYRWILLKYFICLTVQSLKKSRFRKYRNLIEAQTNSHSLQDQTIKQRWECSGQFQYIVCDISIPPSMPETLKDTGQIKAELLRIRRLSGGDKNLEWKCPL